MDYQSTYQRTLKKIVYFDSLCEGCVAREDYPQCEGEEIVELSEGKIVECENYWPEV
jgi:hypothetical protein